jgi:2-oxoglutarate dehydrogenase E2 component (dihydrolipoamide succinyltransferase)
MPALGEEITEGTVTRWLKQVGERVEAGEPLVEVSTDKVDTEIPADASGELQEIRVPAGKTAPVGTTIAVIEPLADMRGGSQRSA